MFSSVSTSYFYPTCRRKTNLCVPEGNGITIIIVVSQPARRNISVWSHRQQKNISEIAADGVTERCGIPVAYIVMRKRTRDSRFDAERRRGMDKSAQKMTAMYSYARKRVRLGSGFRRNGGSVSQSCRLRVNREISSKKQEGSFVKYSVT
jgi:hypothetical protein